MKNKSEIRSRLISSIKVILAVGAMIAICTFVSRKFDTSVYANEPTTSSINWTATVGTPTKILCSDGQTECSGITATDIKIKINDGNRDVVSSTTSRQGSFNVNDTTRTYTLSVTDCTMSGGVLFNSCRKTISGTIQGSSLNLDIGDFNIITNKDASTVAWVATLGEPTIYYKDGKTKYDGITASNIKITIKKGESEIVSPTLSRRGNFKTSDTSGSYELSVTGCDLSGGALYSSSSGTVTGTITNNQLNLSLDNFSIITTTEASDYEKLIDNYSDNLIDEEITNSGDFEIKVSDFDDDFVKAVLKYLLSNGDDDDDYVKDIKNAVSGSSTKIKLTFKIKDGDPSSKAKDRMKDAAKEKKNGSISDYFDLSLKLTIGNKEYEVSDIGSKNSLEFKVKVPSDSRKSSRQYNTVRDHDDKSKLLNDSYKDLSDDKWLSFKSYLFSDYAIAYTDSSSSSSKSSSSSSSRSSSIASARTPTTGVTSSGNAAGGSRTGSGAPKTGDEFNAKLWIYFLVVGVVVALCAFILYQDTKDWRDEKKEAK